MTSGASGQASPPRLTHARGSGPERDALQAEVERAGIALPIRYMPEWFAVNGSSDAILSVARDAEGTPLAVTATGIAPTRALPGHHLYRIERFSAEPNEAAAEALLAGVTALARKDQRCLRFTVELFEPDDDKRRRLGSLLAKEGFVRASQPRGYQRTLVLDLTPGADALLAALSGKIRRDVREPAKKGFEMRRIDDPAFAGRLAALMNETYARTGGSAPPHSWPAIIELSRRFPERSHVCGLFDPAISGEDAILAFAWGTVHRASATYEAGASTRRADLGRTPLAYAPLWDLVAWSTGTAATWFEFGGVTPKDAGPDDPFAGISTFKRFFGKKMVEIGEDWSLEPKVVRSAIARAVSAVARRMSAR